MKKITITLFTMLAVIAMAATLALAEPSPTKKAADDKGRDKPCPSAQTTAKTTQMGECCVNAALSGQGCCGMTAENVKAAFASCPTAKAAKADMKACCAEALDAGKGCCGNDAKGLKAEFVNMVEAQRAAELVKAEMHSCCAEALDAGKGCCGKDAEGLKAGYQKKVKEAIKELAAK